MLSRLLAHRELGVGELAAAVGVPEAELAAVLDGAEPSASLLRGLAPALGMHASDLFVIAGRTVPDDLAPMRRPIVGVMSLVMTLVNFPEAGRRVLELVRAMPQEADREPAFTPEYERWSEPGFGATLLRLFGNRNMTAADAVTALHVLAGFGPWSRATLDMVARRREVSGVRNEVSADLVAACAVVLGIQPGDLAALAGMDAPERPPQAAPATPEVLELIWKARHLTAEQLDHLREQDHMIRHEYDDMTPPEFVCHCPLFRGRRRQ